ncbi:hypothetical protein QQ045_005539 [Rhodiola kirilowii]
MASGVQPATTDAGFQQAMADVDDQQETPTAALTVCGSHPYAPSSLVSAAVKPRLTPRFTPVELPPRQYGVVDGTPIIHFTTAEFDAGAALFCHSLQSSQSVGLRFRKSEKFSRLIGLSRVELQFQIYGMAGT